jgi:hypothetical protein
MRIAILSWGSLIQTGVSRGLKIVETHVNAGWNEGGPILPIEFSRISQSGERAGCLTLVIDERNGINVPTKYAVADTESLDEALTNLRVVEHIQPEYKYTIGYVNLASGTERTWARTNTPVSCNTIKAWAQVNLFDAVIWVALISNFQRVMEVPFSVIAATQYLSHLPADKMEKAFEYIRNAPADVVTPLRRVLDDTMNMPHPYRLGGGAPAAPFFATQPR